MLTLFRRAENVTEFHTIINTPTKRADNLKQCRKWFEFRSKRHQNRLGQIHMTQVSGTRSMHVMDLIDTSKQINVKRTNGHGRMEVCEIVGTLQ